MINLKHILKETGEDYAGGDVQMLDQYRVAITCAIQHNDTSYLIKFMKQAKHKKWLRDLSQQILAINELEVYRGLTLNPKRNTTEMVTMKKGQIFNLSKGTEYPIQHWSFEYGIAEHFATSGIVVKGDISVVLRATIPANMIIYHYDYNEELGIEAPYAMDEFELMTWHKDKVLRNVEVEHWYVSGWGG